MTKEEIKNYIKGNLKIELVPILTDYEINLLLEGEVISSGRIIISDNSWDI